MQVALLQAVLHQVALPQVAWLLLLQALVLLLPQALVLL